MRKEILKFVVLLFVALGAGPVGAAFWQWSKTPINNATSDPTINWSEGMSPSAVNDSARAMMARLAEQAADTSGSLVTSGGPTAYTVTTNQGYPNPPQDGMVIGVTFNVTNAANPTLAVDGAPAAAIVSQIGYLAPADTLIGGMPYRLKFSAANGWLLINSYGGGMATVPIGTVIATTIPGNPADPNYVVAAGECISTTTYKVYWQMLGSPAPGACAAGNFAVIDLRGRVVAGTDVMGGSGAAGRLTSSAQGCGVATTNIGTVCNGGQSHTMSIAEIAAHAHSVGIYDPQHYHAAGISDPGHYHGTALYDPGHYHSETIYDPQHSHGVTGGTYGMNGVYYNFASGGTQGGQGITISISNAATGVRANSANGLDTTYTAGVGLIPTSSNGNGTTYTAGTGIAVNGGSNGNNNVYSNATGVRANSSNGLDTTYNQGSTTPFSVVQPTMVLNYIIRVL